MLLALSTSTVVNEYAKLVTRPSIESLGFFRVGIGAAGEPASPAPFPPLVPESLDHSRQTTPTLGCTTRAATSWRCSKSLTRIALFTAEMPTPTSTYGRTIPGRT